MIVTWLIVALITWPLLALAVGVLVGRGIAGAESRPPRTSTSAWLRRELPTTMVAPLAGEQRTRRA